MVKLIARIHTQPGQSDVVAAALRTVAAPSRAEAGNIMYDICRSQADPNVLLVLEEWESQAALDAHMATPHFKAFVDSIGTALAGAPELELIDKL